MQIITDISQIDQPQWEQLVATSPTATWFQTREAYDFYASLPDMFTPFVFAIQRSQDSLKGIIVGYITKEKNRIKQLLTRRAIIIGGPLLSDDITDEELTVLLKESKKQLKGKSIYIESRNFNSYAKYKDVFAACGFAYQPHLNFHIDTTSQELILSNLGKSRKRDVKTAEKNGAVLVENPTLDQVKEYCNLLSDLYKTKVKTPLFDFDFFEKLYQQKTAKYFLIEQEGQIVSGTVCVFDKNTMYEWFACGRPSHTYPTYRGLIYCFEKGISCYDMMGAGRPNEEYGVRDFKSQFGGKLVEHGRFLCVCNKLLYRVGKLGVKLLKR